MPVVVDRSESMDVRTGEHIVLVRQAVRRYAVDIGFSLVDQTKLVTAASELARNMVEYAGGGRLLLEAVRNGSRPGLRMTFEDEGPGIEDIEIALADGYTTGSGLGLGLGGSRRLSNEFEIDSVAGRGTKVTALRWVMN
jgi:serine/threonine-protein kinase RsbT